jgi:2-iminobutanoate/2-iminopropanoate deaminase
MKKMKWLSLILFMLPLVCSAGLPFSYATRVGDVLFLSGQIGTAKLGEPPVVPGGIVPETKQAMENIKQVLEQNGSSMDHIFKCTVMMADMSEWTAMNNVYVTYFADGKFPARSAFGTTGLAFNARVEIECMATVNVEDGAPKA